MIKKLTKQETISKTAIMRDKDLPFKVRKKAYEDLMDSLLNPIHPATFDPATFDPMSGVEDYDVKKRDRVAPPPRLPTMGMFPKKIFEGQMIGMFESKQDLYLLVAYYINMMQDRIDELEKLVKKG